MASFENVIFNNDSYRENFKGYVGNPPTNESDYLDLDCWNDKSIAPSWNTIESLMNVENTRQIRAIEYPNLADQLDMLWHAIDTGTLDKTSDFYQSLKAVKDKYPK